MDEGKRSRAGRKEEEELMDKGSRKERKKKEKRWIEGAKAGWMMEG